MNLHIASYLRDKDVSGLRQLLEQGGRSSRLAAQKALVSACMQGRAHEVRCLLEAGLGPDFTGEQGTSPLYEACKAGHADIVEVLLETDINTELGSSSPASTPVLAAARCGHDFVLQLLHEAGAKVKTFDENGDSALHLAAKFGHLDSVKYLVKKWRMNINLRGHEDNTPLHTAVKADQPRVAAFLVDRGCDVSLCNDHGQTALWMASESGNIGLVKTLIHEIVLNGEQVWLDDVDSHGQSPLYMAATHRHYDVVQLLINGGVDVNLAKAKGLKPFSGESPMLHAITSGDRRLLQCLLASKKIDVNQPFSEQNVTPVHWAVIKDCDSQQSWSLTDSSLISYLQISKDLLDKGPDLDTVDTDYQSPLYTACCHGNMAILALLCSHGATLDLKTHAALERSDGGRYYMRPVDGAVINGQSDVVKYLVGKGAEWNLEDWKSVPEIWTSLDKNTILLEWLLQNT